MNIILADNQDITRAGLMYVISGFKEIVAKRAVDKVELVEQMKLDMQSLVVLDYTLFDINDADELLIFCMRFRDVHWILFSEDLSLDFVRRLTASSGHISVLMKESPLDEIRVCLTAAMRGQRYICQRMAEMLLAPSAQQEETAHLTKTETEILKDIALGMTTKEIAEKRISSFHTVNTHRKNIFRKIGVNNAHEATKFALRAGLIDSAEYYI